MNAAPHWHVLGAGAMGTLVTASLGAAGLPATLLTHRDAPVRHRWLDDTGGRDVEALPLASRAPASIDYLFISTKAYALLDALRLCEPFLGPSAVVVTCANGRGFEAGAQALLGERPLLRAVSTEAALREADGTVRHTGEGATRVGGGAQPPWFGASMGRLPRWTWDEQIERAIDDKFAINCAINGLTALHRCRNGELLSDPQRHMQFRDLCLETETVLRALGRWAGPATLYELACAVCESTAANRSSMLQDRLAGRRTELEYLNGHLLALAQRASLAAPNNVALCAALTQAAP